jgi:hypothetical protein
LNHAMSGEHWARALPSINPRKADITTRTKVHREKMSDGVGKVPDTLETFLNIIDLPVLDDSAPF